MNGQTTTGARLATAAAATEAAGDTQVDTREDAAAAVADPWVTIVWNDPVNLMSYVSYVFESYFGYPPAKAQKLMLQVHQDGRAVVSSGPRERMEVDVQAMHGFGLWATLRQSGASDGGVDGGAPGLGGGAA